MEINFESHGNRLNGIVYLANGAGPHPTVVLLHGFPGNEKNLDLAQALRRDGFNVLFSTIAALGAAKACTALQISLRMWPALFNSCATWPPNSALTMSILFWLAIQWVGLRQFKAPLETLRLLAGKSVLLIAADADEDLSPETHHVPMVAAYDADPGIDLTDRLLSGDHSYSWSRISLIREVLAWAQDCRH